MPDATANGTVIFGKNSDRPAGECQVLHYGRERTSAAGSKLQCSYVKVPEVEETMATVGCRPYWCWGYETGLNEAGVVGGNAAVYTRASAKYGSRRRLGLTGMELLRLGLERGATAEYAVEVIVELLERYGQWGSAVQGKRHAEGSYENSFLVADRREAWVLETAGERWVAERITEGVRTISNELTIRDRWHKSSADILEHAVESGWWQGDHRDFDFALAYSDHESYPRQVSHIRRMRTQGLLENNPGSITKTTAMAVLRDHYEGTFLAGPQFNRYLPDFLTVCMHESPAGFTWGDTATSMVLSLHPERSEPPLFWTAYLPPCTSIYLPFAFAENLPDAATRAGRAGLGIMKPAAAPPDAFHKDSFWWRLHRAVKAVSSAPSERLAELRSVLDPVEAKIGRLAVEVASMDVPEDAGLWNEMISGELREIAGKLERLEKKWGTG